MTIKGDNMTTTRIATWDDGRPDDFMAEVRARIAKYPMRPDTPEEIAEMYEDDDE